MLALDIAASGMTAQETRTQKIAHDLANMSTTAYQRSQIIFTDQLYLNFNRAVASSSSASTILPTGMQLGTGVRAVAIARVQELGSPISTGRSYDLAIQGAGYFSVLLPDGTTGYTQAGTFQPNASGILVTPEGYTLIPTITVPLDAQSVTVGADGTVSVTLAGGTVTQLGQITLSIFPNPGGLEAKGGSIFTETPASGNAVQGIAGQTNFGPLLQGYLIGSNVDAVTCITELIETNRIYDMNGKVMETVSEMAKSLTRLT